MAFIETDKQTDYVKIEMQNGDGMVVELNEKVAPLTVANFINPDMTRWKISPS